MFPRFQSLAAALAVLAALAVPVTHAAVPEAAAPKVVFQISDAENASAILRFVTNYLVAEPTARVTVVGYGGGIDFLLAGAKDSRGDPWAIRVQALSERGVSFKVCNNTLKSRNLTADAVASEATVVPSAVTEIIRLQTREGFAYFHHVK